MKPKLCNRRWIPNQRKAFTLLSHKALADEAITGWWGGDPSEIVCETFKDLEKILRAVPALAELQYQHSTQFSDSSSRKVTLKELVSVW